MKKSLCLASAVFTHVVWAAGLPSPVRQELGQPPPGACSGEIKECVVGVEFTAEPDGSVSNILITNSSHNQVCDQAATASVAKWRYARHEERLRVVDRMSPYLCPGAGS